MTHHVAVLLFDDTSGFTAGMAAEVFGRPAPEPGLDWYELSMCAQRPGVVTALGGARFDTPHGLDVLAAADTVIVPGVPNMTDPPSPEVVTAVRQAHRRGARVVSLCSGTFALAGAGILDGRRAATHWAHAAELRGRHPLVAVDPDVLYIDDGDILTSAGQAAGLDLCLHLVRKDFGAAIANRVARRLVVQPHREGGQAQFIETPLSADPEDDRLSASMAWAAANLDKPVTVTVLAERAHMSPRHYQRNFARSTGTSPIRWLIEQRVRASLALLETTESSIEQVSAAVGFDTSVTFRHHFARLMRTSPSAYRRAFRGGTTAQVSLAAVFTVTGAC